MNAHFDLRSFCTDEAGQDLVEYGLIIGLMALAAIVAMKNLATTIVNTFGAVGTTLSNSF